MWWDSDLGFLETMILFAVLVCMALFNSAGSNVLDSFSAITFLTYIATIGLSAYHCHKYKRNGVNLFIAAPFTFLSELSFATIFLLVLRDIALTATGGFLLNFLGFIFSLPIAAFVIITCKFPNILATSVGNDTSLILFDGIATTGLVLIFYFCFGFSISVLF